MVQVLAARRIEATDGSDALAVADVQLDGALVVMGVVVVSHTFMESGPRALPPRRMFGDRHGLLVWSPTVSQEIARSVLEALDGKVAVTT